MIAVEANPVRNQLLKLAHDLPFLANAKSKPENVVLAEAKARLRAIEEMGQGEVSPFTTAEEIALGKFDLTYMIDGVLVKDQPAGLVAPKKPLKTNISVDLAIALATGGRFLGYFRVAEPKRELGKAEIRRQDAAERFESRRDSLR